MAEHSDRPGQAEHDEADRVRRNVGSYRSGLRHLSRECNTREIRGGQTLSSTPIPEGHPPSGDVPDRRHAVARLAERLRYERLHDRGRGRGRGDSPGSPDDEPVSTGPAEDASPDRPTEVRDQTGEKVLRTASTVFGPRRGFQDSGEGGVRVPEHRPRRHIRAVRFHRSG